MAKHLVDITFVFVMLLVHSLRSEDVDQRDGQTEDGTAPGSSLQIRPMSTQGRAERDSDILMAHNAYRIDFNR